MARRRLLKSYFYIIYNDVAYGETVNVSPYESTGGIDTFSLASTSSWHVISNSASEWLHLDISAGTKGNADVQMTADPNPGQTAKTGTVVVGTDDGRYSITLNVKLNGQESVITYVLEITDTGGTKITSASIPNEGNITLQARFRTYIDGVLDPASDATVTSYCNDWASSDTDAATIPSTATGDNIVATNVNTTANDKNCTITVSYRGSAHSQGEPTQYFASTVLTAKGSQTVSYQNFRIVVPSSQTALTTANTVNGVAIRGYADKYIGTTLIEEVDVTSATTWSVNNVSIIRIGPDGSITQTVYPVYDQSTYHPTQRNGIVTGTFSGDSDTQNFSVAPEGRVEHSLEVEANDYNIPWSGETRLDVIYNTIIDGVWNSSARTGYDYSTSTSPSNILDYQGSGRFTANNSGSTSQNVTITVTYRGVSDSVDITVQGKPQPQVVYSVELSLSATPNYASSTTVSWSGSAYLYAYWVGKIDGSEVSREFLRGTDSVTWATTGNSGTITNGSASDNFTAIFQAENISTSSELFRVDAIYNLNRSGRVNITVNGVNSLAYVLVASASPSTIAYSGRSQLSAVYRTIIDGNVVPKYDHNLSPNETTWTASSERYCSINENTDVVTASNDTNTAQTVSFEVQYNGVTGYTDITINRQPEYITYRNLRFLSGGTSAGTEVSAITIGWGEDDAENIAVFADVYDNGVFVETRNITTGLTAPIGSTDFTVYSGNTIQGTFYCETIGTKFRDDDDKFEIRYPSSNPPYLNFMNINPAQSQMNYKLVAEALSSNTQDKEYYDPVRGVHVAPSRNIWALTGDVVTIDVWFDPAYSYTTTWSMGTSGTWAVLPNSGDTVVWVTSNIKCQTVIQLSLYSGGTKKYDDYIRVNFMDSLNPELNITIVPRPATGTIWIEGSTAFTSAITTFNSSVTLYEVTWLSEIDGDTVGAYFDSGTSSNISDVVFDYGELTVALFRNDGVSAITGQVVTVSGRSSNGETVTATLTLTHSPRRVTALQIYGEQIKYLTASGQSVTFDVRDQNGNALTAQSAGTSGYRISTPPIFPYSNMVTTAYGQSKGWVVAKRAAREGDADSAITVTFTSNEDSTVKATATVIFKPFSIVAEPNEFAPAIGPGLMSGACKVDVLGNNYSWSASSSGDINTFGWDSGETGSGNTYGLDTLDTSPRFDLAKNGRPTTPTDDPFVENIILRSVFEDERGTTVTASAKTQVTLQTLTPIHPTASTYDWGIVFHPAGNTEITNGIEIGYQNYLTDRAELTGYNEFGQGGEETVGRFRCLKSTCKLNVFAHSGGTAKDMYFVGSDISNPIYADAENKMVAEVATARTIEVRGNVSPITPEAWRPISEVSGVCGTCQSGDSFTLYIDRVELVTRGGKTLSASTFSPSTFTIDRTHPAAIITSVSFNDNYIQTLSCNTQVVRENGFFTFKVWTGNYVKRIVVETVGLDSGIVLDGDINVTHGAGQTPVGTIGNNGNGEISFPGSLPSAYPLDFSGSYRGRGRMTLTAYDYSNTKKESLSIDFIRY